MKILWWIILGGLLIGAAVKFLLPVKSPIMTEPVAESKEIIIYITGAVNNPGLLHLPLDARLDDALKKAGLSYDADLESLNPAQRLKDGQKVIVPFKEYTQQEQIGRVQKESADERKGIAVSSSSGSGKVNINTAGLEELDLIPGVGPALAQRIIDYREQNGLFSSPEEIQQVSGIGPKTYEKMAEFIRVGP